jgi:leader peptidase (prepilin peptidase)/N-methyltransferase
MSVIWPLWVGLFGLAIGSFLNVCIHRLPRQESVVTPRSRCPRCGALIRWYDNLPVLSYALLGGRCRACGASISVRYVVVELVTAAVFVLHAVAIGPDPIIAPRLCLAALLIALFAIDLEHQLLPDALTLTGMALGVASSLVWPPGLQASLIGVVVGAGVLLAIRWLWRLMAGVDAMGLGDVKMLGMIGAFLGWQLVWVVLLLASLAGALVGIALALAGRGTMKTRLPFGTFLAGGAIVASLWGSRILEWYFGMFQ